MEWRGLVNHMPKRSWSIGVSKRFPAIFCKKVLSKNYLRRPHVVYLAGMKFGSTGQEPLTWAMNTWLPAMVGSRFRSSRIVALSTGNVYGLSPVDQGGSRGDGSVEPRGRICDELFGTGTPFGLLQPNLECPLGFDSIELCL